MRITFSYILILLIFIQGTYNKAIANGLSYSLLYQQKGNGLTVEIESSSGGKKRRNKTPLPTKPGKREEKSGRTPTNEATVVPSTNSPLTVEEATVPYLPPRENSFAFLIAGDVGSPVPHEDVTKVQEALVNNSGFLNEHTEILTYQNTSSIRPTKENIIQAIRKKRHKGGLLTIAFCGDTSKDNTGNLIFKCGKDNKEYFSLKDLRDAIEESEADQLIMFIDGFLPPNVDIFDKNSKPKLLRAYLVFSSTKEENHNKQGSFCNAVVNVLKGQRSINRDDGTIKLQHLLDDTENEVKKVTQASQTPHYKAYGYVLGKIIVAKVPKNDESKRELEEKNRLLEWQLEKQKAFSRVIQLKDPKLCDEYLTKYGDEDEYANPVKELRDYLNIQLIKKDWKQAEEVGDSAKAKETLAFYQQLAQNFVDTYSTSDYVSLFFPKDTFKATLLTEISSDTSKLGDIVKFKCIGEFGDVQLTFRIGRIQKSGRSKEPLIQLEILHAKKGDSPKEWLYVAKFSTNQPEQAKGVGVKNGVIFTRDEFALKKGLNVGVTFLTFGFVNPKIEKITWHKGMQFNFIKGELKF